MTNTSINLRRDCVINCDVARALAVKNLFGRYNNGHMLAQLKKESNCCKHMTYINVQQKSKYSDHNLYITALQTIQLANHQFHKIRRHSIPSDPK